MKEIVARLKNQILKNFNLKIIKLPMYTAY